MTRKFKVWDVKGKCWRGGKKDPYGVEFYIRGDGVLCVVFSKMMSSSDDDTRIGSVLPVSCPEDFVVCYHISLLDENDKKVYEGDIVRGRNGTIAVIKELPVFYAQYYVRCPKFPFYFGIAATTVIGNRFENPELLNTREGTEKGE